jgi:hypothetical protein
MEEIFSFILGVAIFAWIGWRFLFPMFSRREFRRRYHP